LLDEELVSETRRLFESFYAGDISLLTPPIAYYEVANSIVKAVRQRRLEPALGRMALEDLFNLNLEVAGDEDPELALRAAYPVAEQLNRSIYDALFLVLARVLQAPLITADKPLRDAASPRFLVLHLADYRLP
jgi:predicted nucleic acid-binding protein